MKCFCASSQKNIFEKTIDILRNFPYIYNCMVLDTVQMNERYSERDDP